MSVHRELLPVADGERRQLWARDLRLGADAPLRRIGPGQAAALRGACHEGALVCPFPGCDSPQLTTVGGSRRHHFRHLVLPARGGHASESFLHVVGKKLVADWMRAQGAEVDVLVEAVLAEEKLRPDILARLPDGEQVGFEVQLSQLPVALFARRRRRYRQAGITDYWLWGNLRRFAAPLGDELREWYAKWLGVGPGELRVVSQVQVACERQGRRLRFIDPDNASFGERLIESAPETNIDERVARVVFAAIDDYRLEGARLVGPFEEQEREALGQTRAQGQKGRFSELRARHRRRRAWTLQSRRLERARSERRKAEQLRKEELLTAALAAPQLAQTGRGPAHPRLRMGRSEVPPVVKLPPDEQLPRLLAALHPLRGHSLPMRELLERLAEGGCSVVDWMDCAFTLERQHVVSFPGGFSLTGGTVRVHRG